MNQLAAWVVAFFVLTACAGFAAEDPALPPGMDRLFTLRAVKGEIDPQGVAVTPDGKWLVASSGQSEIRAWNLETRKQVADLSNLIRRIDVGRLGDLKKTLERGILQVDPNDLTISMDPTGSYVAATTIAGTDKKPTIGPLAVINVANQRVVREFKGLGEVSWTFAPGKNALLALMNGDLIEHPFDGTPPFRVRRLVKLDENEPELGVVGDKKKPEGKRLILASALSQDGSRAAFALRYERETEVTLEVLNTKDGTSLLSRKYPPPANPFDGSFDGRLWFSPPSGKWLFFGFTKGQLIELDGKRVFKTVILPLDRNRLPKMAPNEVVGEPLTVPVHVRNRRLIMEQAGLVVLSDRSNIGIGDPSVCGSVLHDIGPESNLQLSRAMEWTNLRDDEAFFTPDARTYVTYGGLGEINVHRYTPKRRSKPLAVTENKVTGGTRLAFSPDGKTLAAGARDGTVRLFDSTGIPKGEWKTAGSITALEFSPDGKHLAVGNGSSGASLWDVASRKQLVNFPERAGYRLAFSRDGKKLVGCRMFENDEPSDGGALGAWSLITRTSQPLITRIDVVIWDTASGKSLENWSVKPGRSVHDLAISGESGIIRITSWFRQDKPRTFGGPPDADNITLRIYAYESKGVEETVMEYNGSRGALLRMLEDGTTLFSVNERGNMLWREHSKTEYLPVSGLGTELTDRPVTAYAVTPSGQYVAMSRARRKYVDDNQMKVPDGDVIAVEVELVKRGVKTIQARWLDKHTKPVTALAISPDGTMLASIETNGTLRIWPTGKGD